MSEKILYPLAGCAFALVFVFMFGSIFLQVFAMSTRTDNDRRAMIAARMGDCEEAWKRYSDSNGVSGSLVSSFCPVKSPERNVIG